MLLMLDHIQDGFDNLAATADRHAATIFVMFQVLVENGLVDGAEFNRRVSRMEQHIDQVKAALRDAKAMED